MKDRIVDTLFTWPRPDRGRPFIGHGIVHPGPTLGDYRRDRNPYDPFQQRNLPNALARVRTEADILRFVESFGLLGYSLTPPMEPREEGADSLTEPVQLGTVEADDSRDYLGDPVDWFLAHARSVEFALRLMAALQYPGDGSLLEVLKGYRRDWRLPPQLVWPGISYGFAALSGGGFVGTYPVAIGRNHGLGTPPSVSLINRGAKRPRSTREHALRLLTYMVNANTAGVTRALVVYGGGAVIRRGAQSLIQVVWWHIGEALADEGYNAASADQDKDVVAVRECEECGAPFFVTDRRQRFCPTDPRCAERNRKRRNRQRKRSVERGDRRRG